MCCHSRQPVQSKFCAKPALVFLLYKYLKLMGFLGYIAVGVTFLCLFLHVHCLNINQGSYSCSEPGARLAWVYFGGNDSETISNSSLTGPDLRPSPRRLAASWSAGSKLYLSGGRNFATSFCDFWEFDTRTYRWTLLAENVSDSIGYTRSAYTSSNGTHLFLFGGMSEFGDFVATNALRSIAVSDLSTMSWTLLHPPASQLTSPFDILLAPIDTFLPSASWVGLPPSVDISPGPRFDGASWLVGNYFYIFGGILKVIMGPLMGDLWRWDITKNDGWTLLGGSLLPNDYGVSGSSPSARAAAASWAFGTDLYLFGGFQNTPFGLVDEMWKFDTVSLTWTEIPPPSSAEIANGAVYPAARKGATAWTTSDGKLWLYGGVRNGLEQDDMYYFDVQQGSWAVVISPTLDPAPQLDPVYGSVQGAPNDVNTTDQLPAARGFAHGWALQPNTETDPQFWFFGGNSYFDLHRNDMWAFKCYQSKPCGIFPFLNTSLVGECTGDRWIIPSDNGTIITQISASLPIVVRGNITVLQPALNISVPEAGYQVPFTVEGCGAFLYGNLTLSVGSNPNITNVTLVNSTCLSNNITQIVINHSLNCTKLTGTAIQDSSRLYVLINRENTCRKSKLPLIFGIVGGVVLFAIIAAILAFISYRLKRPRFLWRSGNDEEQIDISKRKTFVTPNAPREEL